MPARHYVLCATVAVSLAALTASVRYVESGCAPLAF